MKYILLVVLGVLVSCKTSEKSRVLDKIQANETWITTPSFEISCTVAYPFVSTGLNQLAGSNLLGTGDSVNRINLQGRGDFIRVRDNKVEADMSYYGTQRFTSSNRSENGIVIDDPIKDYKVTHNEKKNLKKISFKVSQETEHYEFDIIVYASGKTDTHVTSSKRDFINYDGYIEEFVSPE